jgi:thioredoxin 1
MSSDEELEKIKQAMLKKMLAQPQPKPGILKEGTVNELTDANFQRALSEADKPVLIDFWAEWCAPCRMMSPIVHDMAAEYMGKAYFAKLNVDQNQRTAAQFGVMSIPYFMVFRNGRPAGQVVGAVGKAGLAQLLQRIIS